MTSGLSASWVVSAASSVPELMRLLLVNLAVSLMVMKRKALTIDGVAPVIKV